MLKRLRQRFAQRLKFLFRPLRCPEPGCGLKCLSKPGLGRHRATHAKKAAQQLLPLPTPEASNG